MVAVQTSNMKTQLAFLALTRFRLGRRIVLPAGPLERSETIHVAHRTNQLATGKGELVDALDRVTAASSKIARSPSS